MSRERPQGRTIKRNRKKLITVREASIFLGMSADGIYAKINRRWPPLTVVQKHPGGSILLVADEVRDVMENGWYPEAWS